MKKFIAIFLSSVLILLAAFYLIPVSLPPLNALLIYALEKRFDADLNCASMKLKLFNSLDAKDIKAVGRDGVTLLIEKAEFSYSLISILTTGKLELDCSLQDVTVIGEASILDLLADLLSIEFLEFLKFDDIKGTFFLGRGDTITRGLTGTSKDVKFYADGVTQKDNSINLRLRIFVNDSISASIPKEIREMLLKEEGPWMSISMGVTGNYKKPSLRLLSDGFRLNISAK